MVWLPLNESFSHKITFEKEIKTFAKMSVLTFKSQYKKEAVSVFDFTSYKATHLKMWELQAVKYGERGFCDNGK